MYDLAYDGESTELEHCIVRTIAKLPKRVAAYTLGRCFFLSIGVGASGMVVPGGIGKPAGFHSLELAIQYAKEQGNQAEARRLQKRLRRLAKVETWIILLAEQIMEEGEQVAQGIIAHEIAHAWLKHNRHSPETSPECEIEAANLARQWGFMGRATDVEQCLTPLDRKRLERVSDDHTKEELITVKMVSEAKELIFLPEGLKGGK